jgi:bifunctional non-homologous end joining protein LigD
MAGRTMTLPVLAPMLARPADKLPEGAGWSYEVKWDGYRCLAVKDGARVTLHSRHATHGTNYPGVIAAVAQVHADQTILDGEIVALGHDGRPSFQALQHRKTSKDFVVAYYVFDVLHLDGRDLQREPLRTRRELVATVVRGTSVLLSDPLPGTAASIERSVRAFGLEGVVAKRIDSRYEPGQRSGAWVKVKFQPSQDFVIGGFLPDGKRVESLIVGVHDGRKLMATGNVRAGLTVPLRRQLYTVLEPLRVQTCPFANLPNARHSHWYEGITQEDMEKITWVKPKAVAEIAFTEWTAEGLLRHARYVDLRSDVEARAVRRQSTQARATSADRERRSTRR